jgi:pimeloyl-ACP methyl ester carboxylesterase
MDAGFAVLAVDHPGFGQSPAPSSLALGDWDPQPTARAAYAVLTARDDIEGIYALGHSMGTSEVLRLLGERVPLAAALILGGGVADQLDPHDDRSYWIRRFRTDRGLSAEAIDPNAIRAISKAYYDNAALADAVPRRGPPIHIGYFGVEWPNVKIAREQLNAHLPENTIRHELGDVGHYFDGRRRGDIVLSSANTNRP